LIGSVWIWIGVTTPDTSDFVVSTTGDSPVTVTDSDRAWIFIVKSCLRTRSIVMVRSFAVWGANPESSAVIE